MPSQVLWTTIKIITIGVITHTHTHVSPRSKDSLCVFLMGSDRGQCVLEVTERADKADVAESHDVKHLLDCTFHDQHLNLLQTGYPSSRNTTHVQVEMYGISKVTSCLFQGKVTGDLGRSPLGHVALDATSEILRLVKICPQYQ